MGFICARCPLFDAYVGNASFLSDALTRPPQVRTTTFLPPDRRIYWQEFGQYRTLPCLAGLFIPNQPYYAVLIHRSRSLPPTSFRFGLTTDTLVFGSQFLLSRPVADFHRLVVAHAERTSDARGCLKSQFFDYETPSLIMQTLDSSTFLNRGTVYECPFGTASCKLVYGGVFLDVSFLKSSDLRKFNVSYV